MPLVPFAAGQKLTAANLNAAFDITRIVYQSADQTVNNTTTYVSSSNLVLSLAANSVYVYKSCIVFDTGATPDFKHKLLLPAGAAVRRAVFTPTTTVAATNTTIGMDTLDLVEFASGGVAAGTMMTAFPMGTIYTAGTAGSVTVQFAQQVANASNTVLKIGSWIELTKVL